MLQTLTFSYRNVHSFQSTGIIRSIQRSPFIRRVHRASKKGFVDFPFQYHEELQIRIEDITNLGMGIGRINLSEYQKLRSNGGAAVDNDKEDDRKWVIMVPHVITGELVKVRIYRNFGSYSEADLVEVIEPSNDRVQPLCKYAAECGGCQYQHMNIQAQRQWKKNQVKDLLQRIGEVQDASVLVNDVVGTDHLYSYRSKITPHYEGVRPKKFDKLETKNTFDIGFLRRGSRQTVDIDECKIATRAVNNKYTEIRTQLLSNFTKGTFQPKKGATLLLREADNGHVETDPRALITQTVSGLKFTFRAGEFFQNNPYVLPLMVEHVLRQATRNFQDQSIRHLVDTYCGAGLFALFAARETRFTFQQIYGIEVSELNLHAARENAARNHLEGRVHFYCGESTEIFQTIEHLPANQTVIVIDPPRKGCDESFLGQLFRYRPRRIVYISCDPATQARDTQMILAEEYIITDVTPFDLFPQTRHIENVITFERIN